MSTVQEYLVPLVVVLFAALLASATVLCTVASVRLGRRSDRFADALDARDEDDGEDFEPVRELDPEDPLDRLEAEYAAGRFEMTSYEFCEAENRTTPHALSADGSRRCWSCKHTTVGGTE